VIESGTIVNQNVAKYIINCHNWFKMTAEERQHRIREYLDQVEFASLDELARTFGVSVSTIRRDLTILEAAGAVKRTHGGARTLSPKSEEFIFSARDTHQLAEKEAIGRACAAIIQPNQSLILDAGTTVYHVARHLEEKAPQIITNSLPVANLFASNPRVELVLSGGVLYPRLGVLVGPLAVETFNKIHADVAIMSAGGITPEGLTNSHSLLVDIQRAMIRAAARVIMCLDHTKFGRRSLAFLCDLEPIDVVVTDSAAPPELVSELQARGIEVLLAPVQSAPAEINRPESGTAPTTNPVPTNNP
jgi:DeoR/GlpR family transcriptional regulator of sugar metabolism